MRFWRTSWRKGYRASIADDLQHHSYGGAGVQRSQHHRFACVSDQPLPALLRYACGNQGWGGVGLSGSSCPAGSPVSICPTQASRKGPAVLAREEFAGMREESQWEGGKA